MERLEVSLLGGFAMSVDGVPVPRERWGRPQARTLVKLLALGPGHRLHREQVIDALWPDATVDEAAPRLHKLAHYARRATGDDGAVVLADDQVELAPGATVDVDVDEVERLAGRAVEDGDAEAATRAARLLDLGLLPEDRYEPWCDPARRRLEDLHRQVLAVAGDWEQLLALEPADERAHLALMRRHRSEGRRALVLRQYERLEAALLDHLGVTPGPEARRARDEALAAAGASRPPDLVGRDGPCAELLGLAEAAATGEGRTVLVSGPPGIGKTALVRWLATELGDRGWSTARGEVATVDGHRPGAPLLEVLWDLADAEPAALDELGPAARDELTAAWAHHRRDDDTARQRLMVAAERLVAGAAARRPVLLVLDDLDRADRTTLTLFHHLARGVRHHAAVVVATHRAAGPDTAPGTASDAVRAGLPGRDTAVDIELGELDRDAVAALAGGDPARGGRIAAMVGGNPLLVREAARALGEDDGTGIPAAGDQARGDPDRIVARSVVRALDSLLGADAAVARRLALLGTRCPVGQAVDVAAGGDGDALDTLAATGLVEPVPAGYRFRYEAVRDAVVAAIPPAGRRRLHAELAERLVGVGAPARQVAHHLVESGDPVAAMPHQLEAAVAAQCDGAHDDGLALVDAALPHAGGGTRASLLQVRAEMLDVLGDPGAVAAYAEAIATAPEGEQRMLRAKRARVAMTVGDIAAAGESLDGLEPDGGDADGLVLLTRGMLAFYHGDLDGAEQAAVEGRQHALRAGTPSRLLDAITLDSLVAHTRGRWYERVREELDEAARSPGAAAVVFDSHLCVAEYLLYGQSDYAEVVDFARSLRRTGEGHGVARAVAFAATLEGEALLLAGDLDDADRALAEASERHRELRAPTGESLCTQRRAEVRLARGEPATARWLLDRALLLARWSPLSRHLLPRIHGTQVEAAESTDDAVAVVEQAGATTLAVDECFFCPVMFEIPATIAFADAGMVEAAEQHLARAEGYAARWQPSSWDAALLEARAHLREARGDRTGARDLAARAVDVYTAAGQAVGARRSAGHLDRIGAPAP